MKRLTLVIEYKEGQQQPSFHADMECLGGVVVGVMFGDALQKMEDLEEALDNTLSYHVEIHL